MFIIIDNIIACKTEMFSVFLIMYILFGYRDSIVYL